MTISNRSRRVVVTGMGAVTPIGIGVDDFWQSLVAGVSGTTEISSFDTDGLYINIAAEVKDFDPARHLTNKLLLLADRFSQFAAIAAAEAMTMAGLGAPLADPMRTACIIGSGAGGLITSETGYYDLFVKKKKATHPLTLLRIIGSSASAHVGIEYGITGPTFGTVSACSTATHAIGLLMGFIRQGLVDVGIAGASEAVLTFGTMRAWQAMRVLSPDGCYPFARRRNGTVLGEGSGVLVLEDLGHARARGATILAELKGFAMTSDAKDMVNPDVAGPREAMRLALTDADVEPGHIDYLNAHGTATTINDVKETQAIREVFGPAADGLAVSSTKSMHGHLLGAGGGVEAIACIKAIGEGTIPPTIGFDEPGKGCDLDYTPNTAAKRDVSHAVSNSFAFGGLNAVLVFGPPPAD